MRPTIERAFQEVEDASQAVDTAIRALSSARRRLDQAHHTFLLIHPGNPTSQYAPEPLRRDQE